MFASNCCLFTGYKSMFLGHPHHLISDVISSRRYASQQQLKIANLLIQTRRENEEMKKMIENQSKNSGEKTASKRKRGKRGGIRQNEREKRQLVRKIQNRISLLLDPSYHNQLLHSECSDRNLPCASFMKGYCKKNSSCTFHHDKEARSMKWEEEKKVEKEAKNHINNVNFTSFNQSTSFNQAKNTKSYSQGSQVAGGQTARSLGHPRGGHAGTGVNYGPRPGSASSNPGSSGQQTATSQAPAESHQLFTQPPPAVIQPFSRQVSTPGPYPGPGPIYPHPQTPGVNIGNIDARGPGQGIPPSSAGWNSVSVASLKCQRMQTAASSQVMSRILRQEFIRNGLVSCRSLITAARFQPAGVINIAKVFEKEADLRRQLNTL